MIDVWDANGFREIPLRVIADRELGANKRAKRRDPSIHCRILSTNRNHAIELQIANVAAIVMLDVVHNRSVGEIAVKGKVARNALGDDPINELLGQGRMVLEWMLVITLFALAKAPKVEWVVLAGRIDVVDEQIVVGNQVALIGMIPKPANIVDQFAIVVDQGVINRDDAVLAIAGGWVVLEPFQALLIQALRLPG